MKEFETQNRAGSRWKQMIEEQAQEVPTLHPPPVVDPAVNPPPPMVLIYDNNVYHNKSLS